MRESLWAGRQHPSGGRSGQGEKAGEEGMCKASGEQLRGEDAADLSLSSSPEQIFSRTSIGSE